MVTTLLGSRRLRIHTLHVIWVSLRGILLRAAIRSIVSV